MCTDLAEIWLGHTGDSVQIVGSAVTASIQTVYGMVFNVYTLDGAGQIDLFVQQSLATQFVL